VKPLAGGKARRLKTSTLPEGSRERRDSERQQGKGRQREAVTAAGKGETVTVSSGPLSAGWSQQKQIQSAGAADSKLRGATVTSLAGGKTGRLKTGTLPEGSRERRDSERQQGRERQ